MADTQTRIIAKRIFDPSNSFSGKGEHAKVDVILCCCPEGQCGLLARGECCKTSSFLSERCPYGKNDSVKGWTKRSRKFNEWMSATKKEYEKYPNFPKPPTKKMIIVGGYLFFPYSHANMIGHPFLEQGGGFRSGSNFVPLNQVDTEEKKLAFFIRLADFRPSIPEYQSVEVPKFLKHLYESDTTTFMMLAEKRPDLVAKIKMSNVGRLAQIWTLKPDIELTYRLKGYPDQKWTWDGTRVYTREKPHYLGGVLSGGIEEISLVPNKNATVKIESDDWVTEDTVFID